MSAAADNDPGREVPSVGLARRSFPNVSLHVAENGQVLYAILFGLVMLDSLLSYLSSSVVGFRPPVNAAIPVACLLVGLRLGFRAFVPQLPVAGGLFALASAFLVGIVFGDVYGWARLLTLGGLLAAFFVGHAAGRCLEDQDVAVRMFVAVCGAYSLVCVAALLKVIPDVLPLINALGYRDGELVVRPEVTIDQNFQIFYLFPVALLFFLPANRLRTAAVAAITLAAAFVLVRLYTRSGVLLLLSALVFAWITPMLYPRFGRQKLVVLPLLFAPLAVWQLDWIVGVTAEIVFRFTDEESYGTIYGRIYSAQYLLDRLFDPGFWIPRGNEEFLKLTGNIPHFNPTAVYLEAGLLGLAAWITLVVWPLARLARLYLAGTLDAVGIMFFGGGLVVFGTQLSLNAPLYEQVWLWAGAVAGALSRADPARSR